MFHPRQFLGNEPELHRLMGFHALFDLQPRSTHPAELWDRLHLRLADLTRVQGVVASIQSDMIDLAEEWHTAASPAGLFADPSIEGTR